MDLYAENILDHYKHPRAKGKPSDASVEHGELNPSCGDQLALALRIEGDRVTAAGWEGEGCAISQAGMSLLLEDLPGKTLEELDAFTPEMMRQLLGVPVGPRRFKCAFLALHTLKNALRKSRGLPVQGWLDTVQLTEE